MTDQLESNKDVARAFFRSLNEGKLEDAFALFGDRGTWWFAGDDGPGTEKSMPEIAEQFRWVLTGPGKEVQFTERGILAEGNRVLMEVVGSGMLTTGNEYRNRYCFVLEIDDGRIVGCHEYMDTAHAAHAFSVQ